VCVCVCVCVCVRDVPIRFILLWLNCNDLVTAQAPFPQTTAIKTTKFYNIYMFSSSCVTAWWWPEFRVETSCHINANYLKGSWLWLWIFIDIVFSAPTEMFHIQFKKNTRCGLIYLKKKTYFRIERLKLWTTFRDIQVTLRPTYLTQHNHFLHKERIGFRSLTEYFRKNKDSIEKDNFQDSTLYLSIRYKVQRPLVCTFS
jgi:hypothetical protein